jgi:peptide/nickel transport system substrate-binding protein
VPVQRRGWLPATLAGCGLLLGLWHGTQAATPPGVLVIVQDLDDIVSLDPAEGYEQSSMQAFTNLYQRLVQPGPDHPGELEPVLAANWQAAPGSLVFQLRPGAAFANGDPVRPEDVIWSLTRAVKLNRSPAFILGELGWTADNIDRQLRKVDEHHVRLSWNAPVSPAFALNILGSTVASILDAREVQRHAVADDAGNRWLHDHSAGSGPFRIRRYIAHEALVLDANARSPGDSPHLATLVIRSVPDAATRELLLRTGDADIARDLGADQLAALAGRPGLVFHQYPSAAVHYLLFNTANPTQPALANPALWQAARYLVDYAGLAHRLLKDQFAVHQAFLAQGFPGALDETPYHLDIPRARSILQAAGLDRDLTITLDVFNQEPFQSIAQSLQASFAAAGIRLEIHPALTGEIYARVRTRTEQAVWLYWIPDYSDAHSTASAFALNREDGSTSIAWRAGWHIPALSAQTLAAVQESDPRARQELYRGIQAQVQRNSPYVIALQERRELAMRANVHGYRQGLNADMVYYDQVTK